MTGELFQPRLHQSQLWSRKSGRWIICCVSTALAKFSRAVEAHAGRDNVLTVFSADHGFMNTPEYSSGRGFEAGPH